MTVAAPPKPPPPPPVAHPDPEALIKEARRRARRRRLAYLGGAVLAAGIASAWFGFGGGTDALVGTAPPRGPQPASAASAASGAKSGPEGGLVLTVADDPDSPGVLYAGTRVGVFVSRDGGNNWRAARSAPVGRYDAIAVAGRRVYAGNGDGIVVSADAGRTWQWANVGLRDDLQKDSSLHRFFEGFIGSLTVDPANRRVVYAGSSRGIFKTTNGGKSWRRLTAKGWVVTGTLAIDPRDSQVVYAVVYQIGGNRIWKSIDGGRRWRTLATAPADLSAIAIDPQRADTVYAATSGHGVYKSTDGGGTWHAKSSGLTGRRVSSLAVDRRSPSLLLAGTDDGIFTSADGAESWAAERMSPSSGGPIYIGGFAVDGGKRVVAATMHGIYRRRDGGWEAANVGLTATAVAALAVDGRIVYAGTSGDGLFKSVDRGRRWSPANDGPTLRDPKVPANVEAFAVEGRVVYAASSNAGVFRSDDRGRTWRPTDFPRQGATAVAAHQGTVYAAPSRHGLVMSRDGGTSWRLTLSRTISALALDGDVVYAGGFRGVFRSTDGGATWTNTLVRSVASLAVAGGSVYAGTRGGGVFASTDQGVTWHPAGLRGKNIGELAADARRGRVYAGSFRGLFASTNGGTSWRRLSTMPVTALAIDPADGTVHAGTAGGGVVDF